MTFSWRELFALYVVRMSTFFWNVREETRVLWHYYRKFRFAIIDLTLKCLYLFRNPYRISRLFLQKKGDDNLYQYGETPLTTMEKIVTKFGVKKGDKMLEMGCGRGRVLFWLEAYWGCLGWGVEEIPEFVRKAKKIINIFRLEKSIEVIEGDLLSVNIPEACDWVYIYGSSWDEALLRQLTKKLIQMDVQVISVSFALSDYDEEGVWEEIETMEADFLWGTTTVYLTRKK